MFNFELVKLFASTKKGSFVVFEDIDDAGLEQRTNKSEARNIANFGRRQGQDYENENISLSALLNALNGIASPEGLVVFLISNHSEKLDAALTRSGRIDRKIFFDLPSMEQIIALFTKIYVRVDMVDNDEQSHENAVKDMALRFATTVTGSGLTVVDVQGYLLEWKDEPARALANVKCLKPTKSTPT